MFRRKNTVGCPECGERFSSRGLPGHRRFKHGVATPRSSISAPAAQEIRETLSVLCSWVERVDARLATLEATALDDHREGERELLERELRQVLGEIAETKHETDGQENGDPASEAYKRLGELRLRQASILMRMGKGPAGADEEDELGMMRMLLK